MKKLTLQRTNSGHNEATTGILSYDGFAVHTLELPWNGNRPFKSCIPAGVYTASAYLSPKFGKRYLLNGVTGRTHILIHPGNYPKDTYGCILPGLSKGWNAGQHSVGFSRMAVNALETVLGFEEVEITVKNA